MKKNNYAFPLAIILLCSTTSFAQTSYTSIQDGDWNDAAVWSPPGVPGASDNVYIDQQTIVSTNGQREVAGFSILVGGELALTGVDGSLTITSNASWGVAIGGGIIRDVTSNNNGVVTIANGAVMEIVGSQFSAGLYGGAKLLNQGTIRMVSFGIWGKDNSVIENQAIFEIDSAGNFGGFPNGGTFINTSTGTFRKSSGMGDCSFNTNWEFQNLDGSIDVQSGSVTFNCDGIFSGGSYNTDAGTLLHFDSQNHTFEGTLSGAPAGRIEISAGVTANTGVSGVTFDFQGTGLAWSGGTFTGSMITIPSTGLLVLDEFSFSSELSGGSTLINLGTIRQDESLGIRALDLSIVDNQSLYEIFADNATFGGNPNGGIFINTGIFRNMGSGTCSINANWEFQNLAGGIIDAANGEIDITILENTQGAIIKGTATIDVPTAFTNNGITSPGNSPGALSYIGDFLPSETALLKVELGGLTVGTEHDQLAVTGNAALNGSIDVTLVNGYTPFKGDSYIILTTSGVVSDTFITVNTTPDLFISVQVNPNDVTIVVDSVNTSSIEDVHSVAGFKLGQNYPNPFYSNTKITFEIYQNAGNQEQEVSLKVFNLSGKEVANLMNRELSPGTYEMNFDGTFLPGGIYLYKLWQGNFISTKKMVLMR